jgi:hypothetical protein
MADPASMSLQWCKVETDTTERGWVRGHLSIGRGVEVAIQPESQRLLTLLHIDAQSSGVSVRYAGHKDDVAAAGCMPPGKLRYKRFCDDGCGGLWFLQSKAWAGNRGAVQLTYYSGNRAFVRLLPGVLAMYPEALGKIATRPQLQLVVDNTR